MADTLTPLAPVPDAAARPVTKRPRACQVPLPADTPDDAAGRCGQDATRFVLVACRHHYEDLWMCDHCFEDTAADPGPGDICGPCHRVGHHCTVLITELETRKT